MLWWTLRQIKSGSWETRLQAATALGESNDPRATQALVTALRDETAGVRALAANRLGKIRDVNTVPALVAALGDPDLVVRSAAVESLALFGWLPDNDAERALQAVATSNWEQAVSFGEAAIDALGIALRDTYSSSQEPAAEALGKVRSARAVGLLSNVLQDGNQYHKARYAAARALGVLGDVQSVEALRTALKDKDGDLRTAAAHALSRIKDPRAFEPLAAILREEEPTARENAAEALGNLGDARAVEPLLAALKDQSNGVRRRAAESLGKLRDPRAVAPLLEALRDEDSIVRAYAASALGDIGDPQAVEPLLEAVSDKDDYARRRSIRVLGRFRDPRSYEPFVAALKDEKSPVRTAAAQALGELRDPRAVEPLLALVREKERGVREFVSAGGDSFGAAFQMYEDMEPRRNAAEAFGKLRDARGVPPLLTMLKDAHWEEERVAAADALGEIGDPGAVERLVEVLQDKERWVRTGADKDGRVHTTLRMMANALPMGHERTLLPQDLTEDLVKAMGDQLDVAIPVFSAIGDGYVRQAAARALGRIGDQRAVSALAEELRGAQPSHLAMAALDVAKTLAAKAGAGSSLQKLVATAEEQLLAVRTTAAESLARIGSEEARQALRAAGEDTEPRIRRAASQAR